MPSRTERADRAGAVLRVPRQEFLTSYWAYAPGEHVSVLAPTQWGKTTLLYQLLQMSSRPELPGVVLAGKPRDAVLTDWTRQLGYKLVRTWPPAPALPGMRKPNGWTLWPKLKGDFARDNAVLRFEFHKAIQDSYNKGNRILYGDEMWGIAEELGLEADAIAVWSRGAAMGCGLWAGTQKPSHVPLWMYSQAYHLFLGNDPDEGARKRFGEIGGVDPLLVRDITERLRPYEWLYIKRRGRIGPEMCIVLR
jgi:hypothetical protein